MKELFEQLLTQFKELGSLSEEDVNKLSDDFSTKLITFKEEIFAEAISSTNVKQLEEEYSAKLEKLIEDTDISATAKLQEIKELYEAKLTRQDIDATNKVKQLLEDINTNHENKLEALREELDIYATEKLEQVVEHYENLLNSSSVTRSEITKDKLASYVSDFLDTFLEETIPTSKLIKEAKLDKLEQTFDNMKKLLMIDDDYIQEEVKEAVLDAQLIIESKEKEVNDLIAEQIKITKKLNKIEAQQLLEQKTNRLDPKLKSYMLTRFNESSKETIEETFDEAIKAFKSSEKQRLAEARKEAEEKSVVKPKVIVEEVKLDKEIKKQDSIMESYIGFLDKSYKNRH